MAFEGEPSRATRVAVMGEQEVGNKTVVAFLGQEEKRRRSFYGPIWDLRYRIGIIEKVPWEEDSLPVDRPQTLPGWGARENSVLGGYLQTGLNKKYLQSPAYIWRIKDV